MSMLVGVRGQARESEGAAAALRDGIIQQPASFYNGNPSSIIWGSKSAAAAASIWRDAETSSSYSTSSSTPFSGVQQQQQQRAQEEETEKDVLGMNAGQAEVRAGSKGPRRHFSRNNSSRTSASNPTTAPVSSPFTFGFPPQSDSNSASAPASVFGQSGIPAARASSGSFMSFGAGVSSTSDTLGNLPRPGVVFNAQDERMGDTDAVVPAMANLSVKEQGQEAKVCGSGRSDQTASSSTSFRDGTTSWIPGSDVSEKFNGLRLNVSGDSAGDRPDSPGVFVFGAKPANSGGVSASPKPSATATVTVNPRPRPVKVKRSVTAGKGKGVAAGNGSFSVPSPKDSGDSPPVTGECSFSSPSFATLAAEESKGTTEKSSTRDLPLPSFLPKSASGDGLHQSLGRSSPSRSGRNAVSVGDPWVSSPEESGDGTKFPYVAEKNFNSEEIAKANEKENDVMFPSAFTRVGSAGKGRGEEGPSSTQSLSASFAGLKFSDPESKGMPGKTVLASGQADARARSKPAEDLFSGSARKSDAGSAGIASEKAFKFSGVSDSRTEGPVNYVADGAGVPSAAGFRPVQSAVRNEAVGNTQSTTTLPTASVENPEARKQYGIDSKKPTSYELPHVPPEPFVFGASSSHHTEPPSPSTPFRFGSKASPPSPSLSSSTGGGCVSRSASITVSDFLDLKQKNSVTDDGSSAPQLDTDAVTSSFSTFRLGSSGSFLKRDVFSGFRFPFMNTKKSAVETTARTGANADPEGDLSSSSYSSAPSHFVFSAGSGSTTSTQATTSPPVPEHQASSGTDHDAAADLEKNLKEEMYQGGMSSDPSPAEMQTPPHSTSSNSSASFEFRASSGGSKGVSGTRRKGSKTHSTAPRRQSRSSIGLKNKRNVGPFPQNYPGANGQSAIPDDAGSPMDFSPQRFTPPDGCENAPESEQMSASWSQRSQSFEKEESADGDDEWAQYSETDIAMDNLRTAASNLSLGGKHGSLSGRVSWEEVGMGQEENFRAGKENKATGRNGKWKRAAFDDNQTPLRGRDNIWGDIRMDNANEGDSAGSSSTPSADSSASSSGWGTFTFTAGSSLNASAAAAVPRRHARRVQRDKSGAGFVDAGKTSSRVYVEPVGVGSGGASEQNNVGNVPGTGFMPDAQRPVFSFDAAKGSSNLGESEKVSSARNGNKNGVSSKGPSVIFPSRASSRSAEASTIAGSMPRADGGPPTSPRSSGAAATEQVCEKWRLRGNQAYANGDFPKAEEYYSRGASSVPPNETSQSCIRASMLCYSNRAATRMVVGRMREALADCMRAMAVDPNFLRVRLRAASCHLALGEIDAAEAAYKECLRRAKDDNQADTKVSQEATEGLRKALQVREYLDRAAEILENWSSGDTPTALRLLNEALLSSPHSERALELKACVLLLLRKYDEVVQLCEQSIASAERNHGTLNLDSSASQGFQGSHSQYGGEMLKVWRWQLTAKAKYYLGRLEEALELLQKLESVPLQYKTGTISSTLNAEFPAVTVSSIRDLLRHKGAGNEAFQAGKHAEAVEHYTAALACNGDSRPFNAVCFCNRAAAYQALGHIGDAIADCSRAIALDPKYAKAISRRATLHEKIRDYGQCCHDLQRLITLLESQQQQVKTAQAGTGRLSRATTSSQDLRQARERLAKAEEEMKKAHPLDHYMILGLEPSCTSAEIKKAYKKAALRHHPDKAGQFLARSEGADDGSLWKEVGDEVRREAERLFKVIGEAYAILSDPQKRLRYDQDEDIRKLRTRASGTSGMSEIYRTAERAGAGEGRRTRGGWDSWTSSHSYGQHQRWQSGPDAAQPDTYARRGSGRYSSNNSSRTAGDGGRWNEYDWDDM